MTISDIRLIKHSTDLSEQLGISPETEIEVYDIRMLQGYEYSTYIYRFTGSDTALQLDYVYDSEGHIVQKGKIVKDFFATSSRIEKKATESSKKFNIPFALAVAVGGCEKDVEFFINDCTSRISKSKLIFKEDLASPKASIKKMALKKVLDFDSYLPCWIDRLTRKQISTVAKYVLQQLESI